MRTTETFFKIVLFFLFTISFTNKISAQADIATKLDEYLKAHVDVKGFSGTVFVAKNGNILYNKGFGYANVEHKINNEPETRFLLASITKQFTAMGIMLLVNEGKIKLDGKISDYLPYYRKDNAEKITIHQLLIHNSGIPGYTEQPDFFVTECRDHYSTKDFIIKYCMKDLEFEPGAEQKYNNSAYCILGGIIEEISGMSYEDFITKNIFEKVGMYKSGYATNNKIVEKRAEGYSKEGGHLVHADYLDISVAYAAGGLYSTVEDMYLWDRALYTDFLLPAELRDSLFNNHLNGFGYGWVNGKMFGHKMIHHSGGIHGFGTHIARFVDDDICIITLCNNDIDAASIVNMDIAAILFEQKYEIPGKKISITVDEKILKKYEGEYEMKKDFVLVATVENGKLTLQATGQPKFVMLAETETDFFMNDYPISISFIRDKKGKATSMILHQNGDHELKKIK